MYTNPPTNILNIPNPYTNSYLPNPYPITYETSTPSFQLPKKVCNPTFIGYPTLIPKRVDNETVPKKCSPLPKGKHDIEIVLPKENRKKELFRPF
jgi:hypothetical protein